MGASANRAKTSERIFEAVFCAGVWVASAPLHGTRKITKSDNMLKTEIGREQLSFASNNLSANFNACHRISIFLSSIPKSPQPPTPRAERRSKRRSAVFWDLRRPGRVFPAYAGFQKRMRRERYWRKRAVLEPEGNEIGSAAGTVSVVFNCAPPPPSFEILHLSAGRRLSLDESRKQHLFLVPFVERGGVDQATWNNLPESLKGRTRSVN